MPLPGFHGRTEELAWLRSQWDACTARDPATGRFSGGPRMVVVVAESGIGKSRLVHALYQQLIDLGDFDAALSKYEESLEIVRQPVREFRALEDVVDVVCPPQIAARIEIALGDSNAALLRLESTIEHVESLAPSEVHAHLEAVASCCERRTEALDVFRRHDEAEQSRSGAAVMRTRIAVMNRES